MQPFLQFFRACQIERVARAEGDPLNPSSRKIRTNGIPDKDFALGRSGTDGTGGRRPGLFHQKSGRRRLPGAGL
jgi:hypothetical protein